MQLCRRADVRLGLLQCRPPNADFGLPRRAGEIGDHQLDLVRAGLLQEIGQQLDLGEAAGGSGHLIGGLNKSVEQHATFTPIYASFPA